MSRKHRPAPRSIDAASSGAASTAEIRPSASAAPVTIPVAPRDVAAPRTPRAGLHFIRRVYDANGELVN